MAGDGGSARVPHARAAAGRYTPGVRVAVALLLLAGCDQVLGLDSREGRTCVADDVFGKGTPVPIDGSRSVEAARFDPTQSIAFLSLCDQGDASKESCDLFQSTYSRATNRLSFYAPLGVSADMTYDSYATVTPDARYLVFGSSRSGAIRTYISTAENGQFKTATELALIANAVYANEPYLLGDGQTLYLAGGVGSPVQWDVYRARSGGPPAFGGGADLVAGINSATDDLAPVVSDDQLEIFFGSDRTNPMPDLRGLDIFTASRDTSTGAFGPPAKLPALSTTNGIDWPVWLSPDRCDLYYINKVADVATLYVTHR